MMQKMARVYLLHWKPEEAHTAREALERSGYTVLVAEKTDTKSFRDMREDPPAAIVINLQRSPALGREVATALRGNKKTRTVPIVFVDGEAEKIEAVRKLMPDAVYTARSRIRTAVREATANAPANPVVPPQMMDRYKLRTTAAKLGIREGQTVAVVDPPRDYAQVIGAVPDAVEFDENSVGTAAITLWFAHDAEAYLRDVHRMRRIAGRTKLWVLWRKGRKGAEINETFIRETGIAAGLVDYKICSVNETWSGLAFALKK